MSDLIALDNFGLLPQGPTLTLSLAAGHSMAVVGPAASGKTRFLRCIDGRERPGQGRAALAGNAISPNLGGPTRRATLQSIVRKFSGKRASDASFALSHAGLWELRERSLDDLSESQRAAAAFLGMLASHDPIMLVDGQLDGLDVWTRDSVLEGLRARLQGGASLVAATNRLDLLPFFDVVVVLRSNRPIFAGTVDELLREADATTVYVESASQPGVRALVEPFEVSIQPEGDGLRLEAREGQAIAAKLLMEGYGDTKFVVLHEPTPEEAVRRIVNRA